MHSFTHSQNCLPPMGDTRVDRQVDDPNCEPCGPGGTGRARNEAFALVCGFCALFFLALRALLASAGLAKRRLRRRNPEKRIGREVMATTDSCESLTAT